ncbi:hypothetical protein PTSG_02497 [Salpingoeca rosetta]|uniref:PH domain-containing protein n=1 Tax=Salpingoeca rosetta (strain ATCC 50818 / BSB-021) TaxID=946362 RepID=F2U2D2_SALR5|nr:uncharacterized protein PTSG_02497 [Salpingoeca rosetta]EGD81784.1 hypothetical protein PTSG_02497 [Salpingoeca rosetta]|eukprot:XP_004996988.1 hypothetical protein PTSG_02497 [Salpingoeca rosetta]
MTDILNAEKLDQIRKDVTSNLASFTKEFVSLYKSALIEDALQNSGGSGGGDDEGEGENERQLLVRPEAEESNEPLFTAQLVKRGQVRKNWKERFFVVRPDHVIDYYETEDKYKSGGSPKGSINLSGYTVVTNPNQRKQEEKQELAKLFGGNAGEYSKYEPYTLECYHRVKRRWLIKCKDQAQFDEWADILHTCVRNVEAGTLKDELQKEAFDKAVENLRNRLWEALPYGSEVDILTEILANYTWRKRVGDDAFANVPGPANIKVKALAKGFETVYKLVETTVKASWVATMAALDKAKQLVETGFSKVAEQAESTRGTLTDKINDAIEPVVAPMREKVIVPVCTKVAAFLIPRTKEPVASIEPVLEAETAAYCEERATGGNPSMRHIKRSHDKMVQPIEAFSSLEALLTAEEVFGLIPEGVSGVVDNVKEVVDNLQLGDFVMALREATFENTERAAYTFEVSLEDATNGEHSQVQEKQEVVLTQIKEKYHHDARIDVAEAVGEFVGGLVSALVGEPLGAACGGAVEPLDSLIPEPLQEYFSVSGVLEDVIANIIETAASEAVEAAMANE